MKALTERWKPIAILFCLILLALCLAALIINIDVTIVNVTLPSLVRELLEPPDHRTGYLALVRLGQQPVHRLVERADQPSQPDLGAQSAHGCHQIIANRCSGVKGLVRGPR